MISKTIIIGLLSVASENPALTYRGASIPYSAKLPTRDGSSHSLSQYASVVQVSCKPIDKPPRYFNRDPDCPDRPATSIPVFKSRGSRTPLPATTSHISSKILPDYISLNVSQAQGTPAYDSYIPSSRPTCVNSSAPPAETTTVTAITSIYTTICPKNVTHISSGYSRTPTRPSVSTVTSM